MSSSAMQHVFVLAGMHRSGTSLAASILQAGGVNMGERLMGADRGNLRGHFENLDFFEFHRDVLKSHGQSAAGWLHDGEPAVPDTLAPRARGLLEGNAAHPGPAGWGWKDPRSTLFLDFWHALVPDAHFVFIYRSPWEVADSVFRRGTDQDQFFRDDPADVIRVWAHYNRLALAFMRRHPAQSLLVSNDAVVADPARFIALVNERFGSSLVPPPGEIVDKEIMHTGASVSTRPQLVMHAFPETLALLEELDAACSMRSASLSPARLRDLAASHDLKDSFKDWFEHNQLRRDRAAAEKQHAADLAWLRDNVSRLEGLVADMTRDREAAARAHEAAAAKLHEEAIGIARDRDRYRWEWLKATSRAALLETEARAVLRALAVRDAHRWTSPKLGPWTREQALEVPLECPDTAQVEPQRVALAFAGPFRPGVYDVAVEFAEAPPADGVAVRFSAFLGEELWKEVRQPLVLKPQEAGSGGQGEETGEARFGAAEVKIEHPAAACTLLLPAHYDLAKVTRCRVTGPR
jgi:hypothetical protein